MSSEVKQYKYNYAFSLGDEIGRFSTDTLMPLEDMNKMMQEFMAVYKEANKDWREQMEKRFAEQIDSQTNHS